MKLFSIEGVLFEYNENKGKTNERDHKLSFETAALVFFDPSHKTGFNRTVQGEDRWQTVGWAGAVLLFVVHTDRVNNHGEEIIRLISARKANKRERKRFIQ